MSFVDAHVSWRTTMRPIGLFPVPPFLCIKTRLSVQPLIWKRFFILMQIKLIFTRKVVHLASFSKWGFLELRSGLLQCDYNNRGQFNYTIHPVRCNFFKSLKVRLPLSKMFLKSSISFTNYAIFHEKLLFEVNYTKSQHGRISEALHKKWSTWCYSRHLSKLGNCFDDWTTGGNRKRRIMNPSRSPHRTDNTQATPSSQT